MDSGTIYQGSNGRYYGGVDLWDRFEQGRWSPVCWDEESGTEWVETESEELLVLEPLHASDAPDWVRLEHTNRGISITPARPAKRH